MNDLSRRGLTGLRWLYGAFFVLTGGYIVAHLLTGFAAPPVQPTPEAAAFMAALTRSGFMDALLAAAFLAGGLALFPRRTAPLGLALLAPAVAVVLLFHLTLSGTPAPGLITAAVWLVLAWRERDRFSALWSDADRGRA